MIIIAAIGKQSSGKGEIAGIAGKKGFEIVKFRDVAIEEAKRRNFDKGALTLTLIGDLMRKEKGPAAMAFAIEEKVKASKADKIFLEGMRSEAELLHLKARFPNLVAIGIIANEKTRLARSLSRKRFDDPKTAEERLRKEQIENAWGIDAALAKADYLIENNGKLDEFRKAAEELLDKILEEANA